jgi:hypothetical protein
MRLQQTVRTRTAETCIEEEIISREGYKPRNNLMKEENGYLLADFHKILSKRKNYLYRSFNVHMHVIFHSKLN